MWWYGTHTNSDDYVLYWWIGAKYNYPRTWGECGWINKRKRKDWIIAVQAITHYHYRAKKENRSQKKRNDILRNIYSSLVLVSKLDWSKKERIRELMLCNEDAPGVPEKDLD